MESKVRPCTHSLLLYMKRMEWHPVTLFINREREREQGDAIHPLTPFVYVSEWNGTQSLPEEWREREREREGEIDR